MSTTIYLTRHGETLWNSEGRMQGWKDSPLNDRGLSQAQLLGNKLQKLDIDIIYSSPIGRAKHTAEILKGDKNIPIIFDDRLKEINMGKWEGMLRKDIESIYESNLYNFFNEPNKYMPVEGETFNDVLFRTSSFIDDIVNTHSGKNLLIVTHTITLKSILLNIEGIGLENFWDETYIYPTSLSIIKIGDSSKDILLRADISHFEDDCKL